MEEAQTDRSTDKQTQAYRSTDKQMQADRGADKQRRRQTDAGIQRRRQTDAGRQRHRQTEADRQTQTNRRRQADASIQRRRQTDAQTNRGALILRGVGGSVVQTSRRGSKGFLPLRPLIEGGWKAERGLVTPCTPPHPLASGVFDRMCVA